MSTSPDMHKTERRILQLTYEHKLSHLSSCLSAWPIIHEIYDTKQEDEVFILSSGHAGLALYCELEARYGLNAEHMLEEFGIHPSRSLENKIYCSSGSLGQGLPIAVGHALADRTKNVYCLISDGECAEGSIWESLAFINTAKLTNLKVYVNVNGMSAYDYLDTEYLADRLLAFLPDINIHISSPTKFDFAEGLLTHYYVMREEDYESL